MARQVVKIVVLFSKLKLKGEKIMKKLLNYERELNNLKGMENNTDIDKIKLLLQKDNIKLALFDDVVPVLVEVWNKYANKQLGERTREKIRNEVQERLDNNIFCYIANDYYYCNERITITTRDESKQFTGDFKIEISSNNPNFRLVDTSNKIQELKIENLKENSARQKTEDLQATAERIVELHKQAEALQAQINNIYTEINTLSNYKVKSVQYTNTVSHWVI
jgi:hypothetical protein